MVCLARLHPFGLNSLFHSHWEITADILIIAVNHVSKEALVLNLV